MVESGVGARVLWRCRSEPAAQLSALPLGSSPVDGLPMAHFDDLDYSVTVVGAVGDPLASLADSVALLVAEKFLELAWSGVIGQGRNSRRKPGRAHRS